MTDGFASTSPLHQLPDWFLPSGVPGSSRSSSLLTHGRPRLHRREIVAGHVGRYRFRVPSHRTGPPFIVPDFDADGGGCDKRLLVGMDMLGLRIDQKSVEGHPEPEVLTGQNIAATRGSLNDRATGRAVPR